MLHTFACQKSGCLYLRTQPNVKQSLEVSQWLDKQALCFIKKRKIDKIKIWNIFKIISVVKKVLDIDNDAEYQLVWIV